MSGEASFCNKKVVYEVVTFTTTTAYDICVPTGDVVDGRDTLKLKVAAGIPLIYYLDKDDPGAMRRVTDEMRIELLYHARPYLITLIVGANKHTTTAVELGHWGCCGLTESVCGHVLADEGMEFIEFGGVRRVDREFAGVVEGLELSVSGHSDLMTLLDFANPLDMEMLEGNPDTSSELHGFRRIKREYDREWYGG